MACAVHIVDFPMLWVVEHGGLLKLMLRKMSSQLNNPPFSYMIHPLPLHGNGKGSKVSESGSSGEDKACVGNLISFIHMYEGQAFLFQFLYSEPPSEGVLVLTYQ
ncbi:hypothetical protein V8G54_012581 [Vigna mungo]|uniref:Uncharacterized protein n=1 Tax=Vigna mungo TaxID=3915 RepID=A0AAQ3NRG1_VIGMU